MVLHHRFWLATAIGVALLAPSTPQDRARGFLQAVREQMVTGSAFRGSGGIPAIVYQNEKGITLGARTGRSADSYGIVPDGSGGYVVVAALFDSALPPRPVESSRGMDRSRLPRMLQAFGLAAGMKTKLSITEVNLVEDRLEVLVDEAHYQIPVMPSQSIRALLDYETGQLLEWSGMKRILPSGPPPEPSDSDGVRNRVLFEFLVNQRVGQLEHARVTPAIDFLKVQDNRVPGQRTFATENERDLAREGRSRYLWMFIARLEGGRWAHAYADYGTGRLLETTLSDGGGGLPGSGRRKLLPLKGMYRVLDGRTVRSMEGQLVPVAFPLKFDGKAFGFVAGGVAVRAAYDLKQDVLKTPQGTFRPVGALRTALRAMRR